MTLFYYNANYISAFFCLFLCMFVVQQTCIMRKIALVGVYVENKETIKHFNAYLN